MSVVWPHFMLWVKIYAVVEIILTNCQKKGHMESQLVFLICLGIKLSLCYTYVGELIRVGNLLLVLFKYLGTMSTCNLCIACFLLTPIYFSSASFPAENPYFHLSRESHLLEYGYGY